MFKKEGGNKQKTKKGQIHHGIEIPCFLWQLINKFQFVVIYGRRRIGKTALINEFLKDKKAIYFTAIEENKEDNLRLFLSFGFSLIKCDQHKEKELILKTHFDCLGL